MSACTPAPDLQAAAEVFLAAASGKGDAESDESHKSDKSDKAAGRAATETKEWEM